jgi:hypothetical protein
MEYTYKVVVGEHNHYRDDAEASVDNIYKDCMAAEAACRKIVENSLPGSVEGMSIREREERLKGYMMFGDDPFIVTKDPTCRFSASSYARSLCRVS